MPQALRFVLLNERGLRAGWRLIIFLVIFLSLSFVLILPLTAPARRQAGTGMLAPGPQIVGEAVAFFGLLLASWIMSRIERRPMGEYGLPLKTANVFRRLVSGYVFWGFLAISVCLLALHLVGAFDFGGLALHGAPVWIYGVQWLVAALLVGLTEEYLLRGYALYTLADGIGFWPASIVLAVLFGLGHAPNPGETRIGVIATVVFALFASLTLRLTGNLWLAVGAHAGWDWGQSFFYGVSDSGLTAEGHLLNPSFHGPVWLTGGSVGPEGSAVALILLLVMMLLVYLIYRKRKQPVLIMEPGTVPPGAAGL